MLHKEIPFLRIGLPLCAGIISGLYINPGILLITGVFVIIVSGFVTSLRFNKYQNNLIFGFSLSLALYICGILIYKNEKDTLSTLKSEQTIISCTLSDYPVEKENSFMLTVKLNTIRTGNMTKTVKGSMLLYNKKDLHLNSFIPGDRLMVRCTPQEITNRGNPYEFDYRFFMENHGIRYFAFTAGGDILARKEPDHRSLIHKALIIRDKIIRMFENRGLSGERLALVAAITLGQKNKLDPEQKQSFIRAGVIHIMAVSGLHALILSMFVLNLLFFLKRRFNIMRILITILILWSFAFITGLTPSVVRATMMFTFLQAGNLMRRRVNPINSVLASAFVIIIIKPSVLFDAGFLLSYSAVIYIISFYRDLYLKLQFRNIITDKIWQSAVIAIVAQAGTFPLTVMLFNRFPTYFILTNIVIVPLATLLIISGCLVLMLFPVAFLSKFLAVLLNYLTGITQMIAERASSLPLSSIENIGMTPVQCILLTGTIFIISWFLLKRKTFSITIPFLIVIIYLMAGTVKEIITRTTNELIVYNTAGSSAIGIRTGKIINIFTKDGTAGPEVRRHCATLGLRIRMNSLDNRPCFIRAGNRNILICNSPDRYTFQKYSPDFAIFTGSKPELKIYPSSVPPPGTSVIFTESTNAFRINQKPDYILTDNCHIVRKSGAFKIRL